MRSFPFRKLNAQIEENNRQKLECLDRIETALEELVRINHEAVNSPHHREAVANLKPTFTF